MRVHMRSIIAIIVSAVLLSGCAAKIAGTVQLVDAKGQPIADAKLAGIVVNMINTSVAVEDASFSAKTDEKGNFDTGDQKLQPGMYKIEASAVGYMTATMTVEVKKSTRKVTLTLKRQPRHGRRSYRGSGSDRDKIVNPGEVNIQPPSM